MNEFPSKASVHKAVLLHEVVTLLTDNRSPKSTNDKADRFVYIDGTLGGCNHALAIAKAMKGHLTVLGIDRDPVAVRRAENILGDKAEEVTIVKGNFRDMRDIVAKNGIKAADAILLDLGISSDQLENSGKGFTFQNDEPLQMIMGDSSDHAFDASKIVNDWDESTIANIIYGYAEERFARRIAAAIVRYRHKKKIETSAELAEIVKYAVPPFYRRSRIHPATKTFQAIRIAVNDELGAIRDGLDGAFEILAPQGRLAVISFHSLEDRITKTFFMNKAKNKTAKIINKKPIIAGERELAENPRARSAKLRVIEKIQ
ncbi:MAG: 16S rRNA (cytosine(1402)-N(4))-methyltransferase RsmH [Patescibacteria group bacterium]|nr:16S rRNA (cytosine(1402)-N(4))-methyltransferase RsmH [Patescibacteria group bacterium]